MSVVLIGLLALGAAARTHDDSDYSAKETRLLVDDYGRCIVRKEGKLAAQAILRNVNNKTLMREYPRLIDGKCVPTPPATTVKVQFHGDQFRYAIADALVSAELGALPAPNLDSVPPLDHRIPTPPSRLDKKGRPLSDRKYAEAVEDYDQDQAFSYLSSFGECAVRADPAGSRALLLTRPESEAETAAFAALKNAFGNCVEEGHTLAFGKVALRGTIAVNYYRLARAAAAPASGAVR
jgi:hypothetical protein